MKEFVYHRFLLPAIDHFGDAMALHDGEHHASFSKHGDRVLRLVNAMRQELGMENQDRFAVLSLNSHHYVELYHAAMLGAGIINPLNIRLAPAELAHILEDSATSIIFVDSRMSNALHQIKTATGKGFGIRHVVLMGEADLPGSVPYEDLLEAGEPTVPPEPQEDDPVTLIYTGGTTGLPRGALFDQRSLLLYLYHSGLAGGIGFNRDLVYLHQAPLFHITTVVSVLSAPAFGVESVVLPGFEPAACMDTIEHYKVNETVLIPTMLQMLFDHPSFKPERLASLRRIGYGGMPMSPTLLQRLMELLPGIELIQGYGMTEAGALTVLSPQDHLRPQLLQSVGRAVPGVVLTIQSPEGVALEPGQIGEICARGGNLMTRYWDDPQGTAEAFRGEWYHTGDAGWMDHEGYLYLADRLKDMIVTGGENVYSVEVENAISSHPDVAQVAVIGIPSELWGEQVHAIVVPRDGSTITEEEVISHARFSLAGYKVPKSVELRSEPLPLSATMKPLKRELRRI